MLRIIKEWILSRPLKPSIRFDPLIINKKHKHIKNSAKISISKRLFKNANPVFLIYNSLCIINTIKIETMVRSLNFGLMVISKSSNNPRKKNNVQKVKYS